MAATSAMASPVEEPATTFGGAHFKDIGDAVNPAEAIAMTGSEQERVLGFARTYVRQQRDLDEQEMQGEISTAEHDEAVAAARGRLNDEIVGVLGPERARLYGELAAEWVPAAQRKIRDGSFDEVLEVVDRGKFESMVGVAREARFADITTPSGRDHERQAGDAGAR